VPRFDLDFERGLVLEQVSDFAFTDDATPLAVDDTTGSVGSISVSFARQAMRPATMKGLRGQGVVVSTIGQEDRMLGRVGHVSGSESAVSIEIDSVAIRLTVKRDVKPFVGTLGAALTYWAGLCGVPAGAVEVEDGLDAQQVRLVGFSDSVWLRIKMLCAATGLEVVVRDDSIVVRRPRAVVVAASRLSAESWEVDDTSLAQKVTVAYYDPRNIVAGDVTVDFSRSNVPSGENADDPDGGTRAANLPSNDRPPGWAKITTVSDT
jgi:hypothetical protein